MLYNILYLKVNIFGIILFFQKNVLKAENMVKLGEIILWLTWSNLKLYLIVLNSWSHSTYGKNIAVENSTHELCHLKKIRTIFISS